MDMRITSALLWSFVTLTSFVLPAHADKVGRYECNMVGFFTQEPLGDRPDHTLSVLDYSCAGIDGIVKGALYTGSNTVEWDGPRGTIITGGGIHRVPGGRLVTQLTEGISSVVMKNGQFVGNEAAGKTIVRFASGAFAALRGKEIRFTSTPMGPIRFVLDLTTE